MSVEISMYLATGGVVVEYRVQLVVFSTDASDCIPVDSGLRTYAVGQLTALTEYGVFVL